MTGLETRVSKSRYRTCLVAASLLAALSSVATVLIVRADSAGISGLSSSPRASKQTPLKSAALKGSATSPRLVKVSRSGLPLSFEPNVGQTDPQVKFLSRGNHYALFLTGTEAVLTLRADSNRSHVSKGLRDRLRRKAPLATQADVLRMKLVQGNPHPQLVGLDPLPGRNNYFIGQDPAKWHRNVPTYSRVKYSDVYPGVDLVYYGNQRQLEYDFVVRPGADPKAIALTFNGSNKSPTLTIDAGGDLVIPTSGGEVRFHKPVIYQPQETLAGAHQPVAGRFVMLAENRVGFEVGAYDKSKPLVIDPALNYATYLGGNDVDAALAIAGDSSGNAYVTGLTVSTDFPTTNSGTAPGGGDDVFVTKLNPTGTQKVFSTYLGGTATEEAFGIAVDAGHNVYVTGDTFSTDFPGATGGDLINGDVFVTKLSSTGAVVYTKLLGGSGIDFGQGIKVDSSGNTYIIGNTTSSTFPIVNGFQTNCSTCTTTTEADAFVAKLNAAGTTVLYSSFLGGDSLDQGRGIAIDGAGKMFVIGTTDSTDFPTTADAPAPTDPDSGNFKDAFVSEVDPTKSGPTSLIFSTYLGDASDDVGNGIALDSSGNVFVIGETDFTDTPSGVPGFQTTNAGGTDAFIAKFNLSTKDYVFATFLGGSSDEDGAAIAVDSAGNAFVTGDTISSDFPTMNAVDNTFNTSGSPDTFVAKISPDGLSLDFSTYLGGEEDDEGQSIAVSGTGSVLVAGTTTSTNFPASTGALQTACGDAGTCNDGFVASYSGLASGTGSGISFNPTSLSFGSHLVGSATTKSVTVTNLGTSNLSITSMTLSGTNSGDFTLDSSSTCSTSTPVVPDGTCTATVNFKVGAEKIRTAALAITSNAVNGSVGLTGLGGTLSFVTSGQTTATVVAGGTATYNLMVEAPMGVAVPLSCTGAPRASTCTTSTGIVTNTKIHPGTFTVTVTTTARSLILPPSPEGPTAPGWKLLQIVPLQLMGLLAFLALAGIATRRRRARWVFATALFCVLMWGACGGSSNPKTGTPAGTYNLTVSGAAEGITKTIGLTLNVN